MYSAILLAVYHPDAIDIPSLENSIEGFQLAKFLPVKKTFSIIIDFKDFLQN